MKTAVLVSGSGTNLQALLDAQVAPATIELVVSSKKDALALKRAQDAGVKTVTLSPKDYSDRQNYDEAILDALKQHHIDFIVLAGFMRILGPDFIKHYENKIINTHPALLPSFPGLHGARQALEYGSKITGCTVHVVDAGVDTGPIVFQSAVDVLESDDEKSLQRRIQAEEHKLLPKALQMFASGKFSVNDRRVTAR